MAEYINRQALLRFLNDIWLTATPNDFMPDDDRHLAMVRCMGLNDAMDAVKSIPAADVRPVVLCKDCMYAPSGTDGGEDRGFALEWPHDEWPEDNPCPCKCDDGWYSHKPKPDFFCANGKREES